MRHTVDGVCKILQVAICRTAIAHHSERGEMLGMKAGIYVQQRGHASQKQTRPRGQHECDGDFGDEQHGSKAPPCPAHFAFAERKVQSRVRGLHYRRAAEHERSHERNQQCEQKDA